MRPNMNQLLAQAQKMQADMSKVQEGLQTKEVVGSAGGNAVVITMFATGTLKSISIKPEVIDPNDHEMLEDLILTAFKDAKSKADMESNQAMSSITGGLSIPGLF